MIRLIYIVLLLGLLIIEKGLSENGRHRGLILAFFVFCCGLFIAPQLIWAGIILAGINIGRTCLNELWLMRLTAKNDMIR